MISLAKPLKLLLLPFAALSLWAQPVATAVTNGADYSPTLAPGAIAAVFGTNLAPSQQYPSGLPLPTILNTVQVMVNGKAAPLFYVSPTQINFQVPYETAAGQGSLSVISAGHPSAPLSCVVAPFSLGIFEAGGGFGVIQNPDRSANSPTNPVAGGAVVVVYITGIGATNTSVSDGEPSPGSPPATFSGTATAIIGDVAAPVQFVGLAPGLVGLGQANIMIPDLPTGTYPMWILLNGIQSVSALVSVKGSTASALSVTGILKLISSFSLAGVGPTQVPGISGVVDNSVAWFDDTLYVCSPSDIKIVNVKNAAAPTFVQRINDGQLAQSGHNCTVNSSVTTPFLLDLVKETHSIAIYDLAIPAAPVKTTQYLLTVVPRSVAYDGNTAFFGEDIFTPSGGVVVGTRGNVVSVNLSNLNAPVLGSRMQSNGSHPETNTTNLRPYMIVPAPGVLYAASTTASKTFNPGTAALDIYDVSSPNNIQGIGQILVPGAKILLTLAISGTELLAVGDTTGFSPGNDSPLDFPFTGNVTLTMFDISDPRGPKMQGNVIVTSMNPGNIGGPISLGTVSLGAGFYAVTSSAPDPHATGGGGNGSLVIVDARDPQNPAAYTYGTISGLGGLSVANGYLYAAVGSGASIYQIQLP
jgi:uncharacterized protein (TIGR03437 family)